MITQSAAEAAVRQTVIDYYEGWYRADVNRTARAMHAQLAKRGIKQSATGEEYVDHLTQEQMVMYTQQGGGSNTPPAHHEYAITQLDCYEEIASVKVESYEYVEYLHLARENGTWFVVNALYTANRSHAR